MNVLKTKIPGLRICSEPVTLEDLIYILDCGQSYTMLRYKRTKNYVFSIVAFDFSSKKKEEKEISVIKCLYSKDLVKRYETIHIKYDACYRKIDINVTKSKIKEESAEFFYE